MTAVIDSLEKWPEKLTRYFDPILAYDLFVQSTGEMETAVMPDLGIILGTWLQKQKGLAHNIHGLDKIFADNIQAIEKRTEF